MQVDTKRVVLWALDELNGRPNGKTFIQKLCFFVGRVLGKDLGYRAHYYGPYSDQVSGNIAFLHSNGYIYESRRSAGTADVWGWEVARFDYHLTEDGLKAVAWLDETYPNESTEVRNAVRRVLAAGDLDYVGLSLAAKTYWILADERAPLSFEDVASKARQFRWNVNEDEVRKASNFLQKLDLATVR